MKKKQYHKILDDYHFTVRDEALDAFFNDYVFSDRQQALIDVINALPVEKPFITDWYSSGYESDKTSLDIRFKLFKEQESGRTFIYEQVRTRLNEPSETGEILYLEAHWLEDDNDDAWSLASTCTNAFGLISYLSKYFSVSKNQDKRLAFLFALEEEVLEPKDKNKPENNFSRVIKKTLNIKQ